jgi:hypothetical protein
MECLHGEAEGTGFRNDAQLRCLASSARHLKDAIMIAILMKSWNPNKDSFFWRGFLASRAVRNRTLYPSLNGVAPSSHL